MRILLVDDEIVLVTTIQAYFEHEGYEVKSALIQTAREHYIDWR